MIAEGRTDSVVIDRGEVTERRKVTLSREMFSEGSVGFTHFPEGLSGRERPAGFFDQDLHHYYEFQRRGSLKPHLVVENNRLSRLGERGIDSVKDLLNSSPIQPAVSWMKSPVDLEFYARITFTDIGEGPYGWFLRRICATEKDGFVWYGRGAISQEAETVRDREIKELLLKQPVEKRRLLEMYYGIHDGQIKPVSLVAERAGVTVEQAKTGISALVKDLGKPYAGHLVDRYYRLRQFLPFEKDSLGYIAFNMTCAYDYPCIFDPAKIPASLHVGDLALSAETWDELRRGDRLGESSFKDTGVIRFLEMVNGNDVRPEAIQGLRDSFKAMGWEPPIKP